MWGSTPRQRTVVAPLADLPKRVEESGLGAPSVVVVGEVVALRDELAWFERLPLFARRVLVTRPREQARELSAAIRALGGEPVEIPTLRIEAATDSAPLDAALGGIDAYDVLLFASANAVHALSSRARARGVGLDRPGLQVACVGARTAEAAAEEGIPVHLVAMRQSGEGLAEEIVGRLDPAGRRFLLPRSEIGREALPEALRAAGAELDVITAYRPVAPQERAAELSALLENDGLDALTFTSPSTVRNFLAMLGPAARDAARRCVIAAIGSTTARALQEAGLPPQVVPSRPDAAALAEALGAHVASRADRQEAP
jgi:uroporphyrinogen III methyltransferase/synthase